MPCFFIMYPCVRHRQTLYVYLQYAYISIYNVITYTSDGSLRRLVHLAVDSTVLASLGKSIELRRPRRIQPDSHM